jgi:anti-sigma factor RsiW
MICPIQTQESAEILLAYCTGDLDHKRAAAIEQHIQICPVCAEFASKQRMVWQALDAWEAQPVSLDFDRRLYQRIDEEVSWGDRMMRPFREMMARRALPVAATACLAAMAVVLLDHQAKVIKVTEPESVQVETVQPDQVEHAFDDMEMLRQFSVLMRAEPANPNSKM